MPEFHLPGHNFTGPGTKFEKRVKRGDKPINKVDQISYEHDMAYHEGRNRSVADRKYVKRAVGIVLAKDSSPRERAEAAFVGLVIGSKFVLEGGTFV